MVCNEKKYIEAITKDEISSEYIKTIRMSKSSYDMYFGYLYKAYSSQLEEYEKRHLRSFKDLLILLAKNGIAKEIIDDKGN